MLVFDDPDAGNYPHWGVYDIPASETGLAQGVSGVAGTSSLPAGAGELENGFGFNGYLGSCPGSAHIYRWRLYAVDDTIPGPPGGHVVGPVCHAGAVGDSNKLDSLEMCHIYRP